MLIFLHIIRKNSIDKLPVKTYSLIQEEESIIQKEIFDFVSSFEFLGALVALMFVSAIWCARRRSKAQKVDSQYIKEKCSVSLRKENSAEGKTSTVFVITEVRAPPEIKICNVMVCDRLLKDSVFEPTIKTNESIAGGTRTLLCRTEVYPGVKIKSLVCFAKGSAYEYKKANLDLD